MSTASWGRARSSLSSARRAWFVRSWLDRLGLDATRCAIIRVRGESMEQTLPDGCLSMFDCNRRERRGWAMGYANGP